MSNRRATSYCLYGYSRSYIYMIQLQAGYNLESTYMYTFVVGFFCIILGSKSSDRTSKPFFVINGGGTRARPRGARVPLPGSLTHLLLAPKK